MIKQRIVATLMVASVFATPTPVFADHRGEPMYNITFYSDSTYSQVIGYAYGTCPSGPSFTYTGGTSIYSVYEYIAHCEDGILYPWH